MKNHTDSLWHVLNMQILHLDQTVLWFFREIREHSLWNLWGASMVPGSLLLRAAGHALVGRGLITVKGRMEKPSWKSHGLFWEGGGDGWVGDGGGRSQEPVTLETESSLGQYGVRSATLGGDSLWCSWWCEAGGWVGKAAVGWVGGWEGVRVVTHTSGHTLHSNKWTCIESSLRTASPQSILLYSSISLHRIFSMAEHI